MKLHTTRAKLSPKQIKEDIKNRQHYIGGSDIGSIMGVNQFKSTYTLWAEKTGLIESENIDDLEPVWWGVETEALIAKRFSQKTGKKVMRSNYSYSLLEYPYLRAHVDFLIRGESSGLECKSTDNFKVDYEEGELPPSHYLQAMFYMAITGKKRWFIATHQGNSKFHISVIERDEKIIEDILKACADFWAMVQTGTPPEVDGTESTSGTIAKMFPTETEGGTIDISCYEDRLDALTELAQQKKTLDEYAERYKNEIKQLMQDAEVGVTNNYRVTWKSDKRGIRQFRYKAIKG